MNRSIYLNLTVAVASIFIGNNPVIACSVFADQMKSKDFFVAKNFDWNLGTGLVVKNPRGLERNTFNKHSDKTWTSKYASLSLTVLGPGLPVSSMNEKGLVIEALVDNGYDGPMKSGNDFVSLDWAQFALDNFRSTDQVIRFAQKNGFDQIAVPLHLFVCDKSRNCAAFEADSDNPHKLNIIRYEENDPKVLSNGAYDSDSSWASLYNSSSVTQGLGSVVPKFTSIRRFATLAEASETKSFRGNKQIFRTLKKAGIPGLLRWQIIWKPGKSTVVFRQVDSLGNISKPQNHSLSQLPKTCTQTHSVMPLNQREKLPFRNYTKDDAQRVGSRLSYMLRWRTGKSHKKLSKEVVQYTGSFYCQKRIGEN